MLLILVGLIGTAAGAVLVASALRPATVDAGAVLAHLDADPTMLDEFSSRLRQPLATRLLRPLGRQFSERIGRLLPNQRIEQIRHKLLVAGALPVIGPEELVVVQGLSAGGGALAGLLLAAATGAQGLGVLRFVVLLTAVGFLAPMSWINKRREARQASIRRDLPDVLDLLAIAVEAGSGFEGAVEVVTRHFQTPLSHEFSRMLREMELGLSRRDALSNLKRRTEVPELSNFVLILQQADSLGMPIGRVLRSQATEMRNKRRMWAREKAAKLPVKLLVPLMLFILPPLFVVILGPAATSISKAF